MGLTSSATLAVGALLAIAAPLACLLLWNRLGPRAWQRVSGRTALVLTCQASAVLLVGLLVNRQYVFYTSWSELLGQPALTSTASTVPIHRVDRVYAHQLRGAFHRGQGMVIPWVIPGRSSGLPALPALVYLPAAYGNPASRSTLFPVVEMLDGVPGTPQTWLGPLRLKRILDARIASGQSLPFIAVMPTQNVELPRDTQCVNVVGGPKVDTYLTEDVHRSVIAGLRVARDRSGWALMGYSTGGYCAVNLAMRHPDLFSAAVSLSGYSGPASDPSVGNLFGGSTALRDHNTPVWEAAHWSGHNLSMLVITSRRDRSSYRDTVRLAAAVHAPLHMSTILLGAGGHNAGLWSAMEPVAFNWLSRQLTPPLASIVIDGRFKPAPTRPTPARGDSRR
jgi:enterochelin esterase-like enzyme